MVGAFDVGGPLVAYGLLRSAGLNTVTALLTSGILPVLGIALGAVAQRRLDIIGVVVLAGIVMATAAGLITHSPRLYLLESAVPTVVFAAACLSSLRLRRPLMYRLAVQVLGPDTRKGREVTGSWRYPRFRRAFRVITAAWGIGYLAEAALKVAVVQATSTGIALVCVKVSPYLVAAGLSAWTLAYGQHEKKKAERLAATTQGPEPAC